MLVADMHRVKEFCYIAIDTSSHLTPGPAACSAYSNVILVGSDDGHKNRDGLSLSRFAHLIFPSMTSSATAFAVPGALQIP